MIFFLKTTEQSYKPRLMSLLLLVAVFFTQAFSISHANNINSFENLSNVRNTAKTFLEEKTISADTKDIELNIGQIDPRLKLKKCDQPLVPFLLQGYKTFGKLSVGVKCSGTVPWKIFLSATVYHFKTVVIANNALAKGKLISKQDLSYKRVNVTSFRKLPAIDSSQVVMTSPRRFIRAGSIIYMNNICMICKGNKVNVSAGSDYFSINLEAEALADASVGETVRLRNSKSRRIFDGTVVGRNRVRVLLAK
jgi:flagella basal body P-ring formation protein FlgA